MSVRVRFAPSPTGHLHIGGARTALYSYLYAKANKGSFILRIEDTDQARSSREYEQMQINDLKWLGIDYDEGPDTHNNEYGPYRQSERLDIYEKYANKFLEEGLAFYCFCTEEELSRKKEEAQKNNLSPHYDGTCKKYTLEEAKKKIANGEKAVIRFKAPQKAYSFKDHVRGDVTFPQDMVGDFVILRSDKLPVYNFCCAIDDALMKMTHVIRAEEHLPNTLRQLMIYEALNMAPPEFVHVSLIVGKDRQKLSKRHGATSVSHYREEGYLKEAMINYLVLLGWSHPTEKDIFSLDELISVFGIDRFSKSPAVFDFEKFSWVNGQHLRTFSGDRIIDEIKGFIPLESPFHSQSKEWQLKCVNFFKDHINFYKDITPFLENLFEEKIEKNDQLVEILNWETTPQIINYLEEQTQKITSDFISEEDFDLWSKHIKKELKIKGKFLFMGMRSALTGKAHGPELKVIVTLIPVDILKKRLKVIKELH